MRCAKRVGIIAAVMSLASGGCSERRAGDGAPAARSLTGAWEARFTVDASPAAHPPSPVRAELVLVEDGWLRDAGGLAGAPTHYGTFTADFAPLGFDPRTPGEVPSLAAALVGRDSVEIAFQPSSGAASLEAAGHLADDSVVGRWWHAEGRGIAVMGTFRMAREKGR